MDSIRKCFKLYLLCFNLDDYILPSDDDITGFTIDEIKLKTQELYMEFIVKGGKPCIFDSKVYHAYSHLIKMINENQKNIYHKLITENTKIINENHKLQDEIESYKNSIFYDPSTVTNTNIVNEEHKSNYRKMTWFPFKSS